MQTKRVMAVVADIGGTNARFASVLEGGALADVSTLKCADYVTFEDAYKAYLDHRRVKVDSVAIAVACPVDRDHIRLTNNHWQFYRHSVAQTLGLKKFLVINDFTAQSLGVGSLNGDCLEVLQEGVQDHQAPILVIGPGTGLGVGGLVLTASGHWMPLTTEGGHVTLPAQTEEEWGVLNALRKRFSHVSAERVISGPGLYTLYTVLCQMHGRQPVVDQTSDMVSALGRDPLIGRAFELFSGFFGIVTSDACLTLGATQGVYIAGGVIPKLGSAFRRDIFLERFKAKGRFNHYLTNVPVSLITDTEVGLLGLISALSLQELERFSIQA